ncbi:hypothetical protein FDUTEX481_06024 [Tolypothrix sp. PCC 7601]|nr:hypothetical protein FDUTEX481_06024 [Tolypothrix sp. PCC 7601]
MCWKQNCDRRQGFVEFLDFSYISVPLSVSYGSQARAWEP